MVKKQKHRRDHIFHPLRLIGEALEEPVPDLCDGNGTQRALTCELRSDCLTEPRSLTQRKGLPLAAQRLYSMSHSTLDLAFPLY